MNGPFSDSHSFEFDDALVYLGTRPVYGGSQKFSLSRVDRRQHLYCIGKTGTGKSTLLRNLILQDMYADCGVGVIDPHGDLARDLLDHVPSWRTNHVIYFNPADLKHPVGLNLLANVPRDRRHRVASGVVGAMKAIWAESWGPRLEYILYAAIAALLDCENTSILGLQRMLIDARYRRWVVNHVKDPVVRAFWQREFEGYGKQFMQEAIAPIQNKVGQLLMAAPIRNIVGQVRSSFDFSFVMNDRRIFIANLSKGLLGEDKANLLGSLLVTGFELAAMERAFVPEEKRRDFFLHIDEFHNFSTDSFASILSEARKYRLCLTLSHQYLDQVREGVRHAVFGNAGTYISFRVGERDAQALAREYGDGYTPTRFSSLSNFEVLVKLLSAGLHQEPFAATTLPPLDLPGGRLGVVVKRSRAHYASSRESVERKIDRLLSPS
jgi:hypothetical protein